MLPLWSLKDAFASAAFHLIEGSDDISIQVSPCPAGMVGGRMCSANTGSLGKKPLAHYRTLIHDSRLDPFCFLMGVRVSKAICLIYFWPSFFLFKVTVRGDLITKHGAKRLLRTP